MKKVFVKTHGCQMNEYDSARMQDLLVDSHGLQPTENEEDADVILLNTCSIREKAQEKVFHQLGRWKPLKQKNPDLIIGVGGCVASQEGAAIGKRAPYVDLVFGPQTLHRLPEMIASARPGGKPSSTSASRRSRSSTVSRNPASRDRPPSSRSWRAAASTAASASCPTPAARKSQSAAG
jgi:tRNA A37 methylthiotransferase MiaB